MHVKGATVISTAAAVRRWRPRLFALGLGTIAAIILIVLLELTCGCLFRHHGEFRADHFLNERRKLQLAVRSADQTLGSENTRLGIFPVPPPPRPRQQRQQYSRAPIRGSLDTPHDVGRIGPGLLRLPRSSWKSLKKIGDKVIWDATYTIDRFYRRETPGESQKKGADRFLLLFGDSCIFGAGVDQDQTLAAALGKRLPRHRVYNYGILGLFPGEMLERIRLIPGPPEILGRKGTLLYFYFGYHIRRNMGTLSTLNRNRGKPYYFENKKGEIVAERTLSQQRPFWTFLAGLVPNIIEYFNIDWPTQPSDADFRFQTKLLQQLQENSRRLGCDRFYVVLYPHFAAEQYRSFIPYLERANIRYIDFSHWNMSSLTHGPAWIPYDDHPTAETNQILAQALARLIQ